MKNMTNTEFENKVLSELKNISSNVSALDSKVSTLDSKVNSLDNKLDRLDDRLDEVESNLSQEIKMQGAYLNQAFDRMSFLQQNKAEFSAHK